VHFLKKTKVILAWCDPQVYGLLHSYIDNPKKIDMSGLRDFAYIEFPYEVNEQDNCGYLVRTIVRSSN
jgi:hypothetical protein